MMCLKFEKSSLFSGQAAFFAKKNLHLFFIRAINRLLSGCYQISGANSYGYRNCFEILKTLSVADHGMDNDG